MDTQIIDNYKEHKFHRGNSGLYKNLCSECWKVNKERENGRRLAIHNIDTSLMEERHAHPEESYW